MKPSLPFYSSSDFDVENSLIRVLLISGSIRQPSHTRTLTERVEQALASHGARPSHWNLLEAPLPIADPRFHDDPIQHHDKAVRAFVEQASVCDAFVLASPVYHNSYSGVLKNALDNLTIAQFYYKPVGLIGHSGNRSTQAVDHLRIVVRGLLGVATPTQVCTAEQDYRLTETGGYELIYEPILQRIERFVVELIIFANQLQLVRRKVL